MYGIWERKSVPIDDLMLPATSCQKHSRNWVQASEFSKASWKCEALKLHIARFKKPSQVEAWLQQPPKHPFFRPTHSEMVSQHVLEVIELSGWLNYFTRDAIPQSEGGHLLKFCLHDCKRIWLRIPMTFRDHATDAPTDRIWGQALSLCGI